MSAAKAMDEVSRWRSFVPFKFLASLAACEQPLYANEVLSSGKNIFGSAFSDAFWGGVNAMETENFKNQRGSDYICSEKHKNKQSTRRASLWSGKKLVSSDCLFNQVHDTLYTSQCNFSSQSSGTPVTDVKSKFLGSIPSFVKIVEVGPRDELQNEKAFVPTAVKVELIKMRVSAGLSVVEATSFLCHQNGYHSMCTSCKHYLDDSNYEVAWH